MPPIKFYIRAEDDDVQEIIDSLDSGDRSAFIRDAIRAYAGQAPVQSSPKATNLDDVVAELRRIGDALQGISVVSTPATTEEQEDPAAADRLAGMF